MTNTETFDGLTAGGGAKPPFWDGVLMLTAALVLLAEVGWLARWV